MFAKRHISDQSFDRMLDSQNPASKEAQGFSADQNCSSEDELASFLSLIEKDNSYIVQATLKESEFETTQKVYLPTKDGLHKGPYIRKYLDKDAGLGKKYLDLSRAEQTGFSFKHLPHVYECYELKDKLVVVIEFVQGETLQELVYRSDPSVALAARIFPHICDAVQELHESFNPPIIHRDLKPANIILSFDRLVLIDFGIAREYREDLDRDTVRFGTREYAPPEQFGYGQTDMRSDVYALGMLLYYCLTEQTADAQARRANFADTRIPEELRAIIERACSFDPADRFATVASLKQAFMQACAALGFVVLTNTSSSSDADVVKDKGSACNIFSSSNLSHNDALYQGVQNTFKHRHAWSSFLLEKPSALSKFIASIPLGLGIAWNVILVLLWLIVLAAAFSLALNPTDPTAASYPLWFRVAAYGIYVPLLWTSLTYVFLDKRILFSKVPKLQHLNFPLRLLIFGIGAPLALTILLGVLSLIR